MNFEGAPRSIAEMEYVARMFPCEMCGDRRPLALEVGGSEGVWIVSGTCPRCQTARQFVFHTDEDLFEVDEPDLELGLAEPSRIIEPYDLVREIDRLVPTIVSEPGRLTGAAWDTNAETVERVLIALHELAKFLPAGAAVMTPEVHRTPNGASDQRARPERYTRAWIDAELQRWTEVADAIADDGARVFSADPVLGRATPARGTLDPDSLADHRAWLERGRGGQGRLDVVTWDGDELELSKARLSAARLEGVSLRRAQLQAARLDDTELVEVDASEATCLQAVFEGASLIGCRFAGAELEYVTFARARIADCVFDGAALAEVVFEGAVVERASFRGASLADGQLTGGVFRRCDFRGCDLTGCDLERVELIECAFSGAYGMPYRTEGWTVVDADFSAAADRSDLGGAEDLLEELGS